MRLIILSLFFTLTCVLSKTNTKPLTESLGQEVIEIGTPLKDLPADLEEEPSNEADDDDPATASLAPATKKEAKKTTVTDARKKGKDIDVGDANQEDEAKIEKELAEMYKDNNDYNTDLTESTSTEKGKENVTDKDTLRNRGRDTFKFQPDLSNPKEIERFRTSIDEISCDKQVTRKLDNPKLPDSAVSHTSNILLLGLCVTSFFFY